jgi:transposase, IS30 family
MRTYTHLSVVDRETISKGLSAKLSLRTIASTLGCHVSTVSREIGRFQSEGEQYRAVLAEKRSLKRRRTPRRARLLSVNFWLWHHVEEKIRLQWSPQQIEDRLVQDYPLDMEKRISHETIYRFLYVLPRGTLRKELIDCLRQSHRHRRKRRYLKEQRGQIPNLVSIWDRPADVEAREIPGHWEGDLVIGKYNRSAIGTLVERTTRMTLLCKLEGRTTEEVTLAFEKKLMGLPFSLRMTLTYDRGKEMTNHEIFTQNTKTKVYFCDPQSPWQRGTNENTNGLLRQYFPKGTDFTTISQEEIDQVEERLNGRPRKCLQFLTPHEAFTSYLRVALLS